AYVMLDKAGSSGYGTLNFMLSGAYDIINAQHRDDHQLTVGLQLGVIQRTFDPAGYTFDNQYTGTSELFDPNLPNGENFVRTSLIGMDANIGVAYVNMNKALRARPFGGLMFAHLTKPRQSFSDQMDRSPIRFAMHAGAEIDAAEKLVLTPSMLFMAQSAVKEINVNLLGAYQLGESDYKLLLGAGYRSNDAVILQTGVQYKTTTMRIGYDRNISSLQAYTGGVGGFEISLVHGGFFKRK
ncbi:MAG: PorP/SprF family type IX secretion system membrane protein, partial [Bacteroidota bacterium]|nr:PorP/SprF family type IX secretion system membrane protein [Bacteroidota bacterium]